MLDTWLRGFRGKGVGAFHVHVCPLTVLLQVPYLPAPSNGLGYATGVYRPSSSRVMYPPPPLTPTNTGRIFFS